MLWFICLRIKGMEWDSIGATFPNGKPLEYRIREISNCNWNKVMVF